MFRHLKDEHNNTLSHNFRPVQPLGDRDIWFNVDEREADKEIDLENENPYETGGDENELGDEPGAGTRIHSLAAIPVLLVMVFHVIVKID